MKYLSLKKIYHINEQQSHEIYMQRYNSEFSKKLDIYIHGYECFYVINEEIMNLLDKIYSIDNYLEKIFRKENISYLAIEYMKCNSLIEEIRSSNKMEGIYSTRKELKDLIDTPVTKKYTRFYGLLKKYQKLETTDDFIINTSLDIRKLYDEILLDDVIHEDKENVPDGIIFRSKQVEITSGTKSIHQGVYPENQIIDMMDKALKILNDDDMNLLIRVALFHYLLEYIHPFYNGNGRMGRFLACAYLSNKYNILCALQLSSSMLYNNKKYYEAFEITNDIRNKSDLTVFIINFLEIYLSGLYELKEKAEEMIYTYTQTKRLLCHHVSDKHFLLADYLLEGTLFGFDGLSIDDIQSLTKQSKPTIRNAIKEINKEYNIILINEEHKPYRYEIDVDLIHTIANNNI